jgi:Ca2+-binding EF-hand superfamily protein
MQIRLQPEELTQIVKDFVRLDVNKDGRVNAIELANTIQISDKEQLLKILQKLDRDNDGKVNIFVSHHCICHNQY